MKTSFLGHFGHDHPQGLPRKGDRLRMATVPQALAMAIQHHQAGQLQAAEQIYRQILAVEPNQPDALHLLGVIRTRSGSKVAVERIGRAIGLNGNVAVFHGNLGAAHHALRRIPEAIACYRHALELQPDYAEAHGNLGNALRDQGQPEEATACYRRALELKPDNAETHNNLGTLCKEQGDLDEAVACYRRALELKPDFAEAHNNLGNALRDQGQLDAAVACYRRALELKPDYAEAHSNLGDACKTRESRTKRSPATAGPGTQAGLCRGAQQPGQCFQGPRETGRSDRLLSPGTGTEGGLCRSAQQPALHPIFCPGCDARTLDEEHRRWNQSHAVPLAKFILPHPNGRSPDRRLRVGYVSPRFSPARGGPKSAAAVSGTRPSAVRDLLLRRRARPMNSPINSEAYADAWRSTRD